VTRPRSKKKCEEGTQFINTPNSSVRCTHFGEKPHRKNGLATVGRTRGWEEELPSPNESPMIKKIASIHIMSRGAKERNARRENEGRRENIPDLSA